MKLVCGTGSCILFAQIFLKMSLLFALVLAGEEDQTQVVDGAVQNERFSGDLRKLHLFEGCSILSDRNRATETKHLLAAREFCV